MDTLFSWIAAAAVFVIVSLLFGPDSHDTRRACDIQGSWVGLTA